MTPETITPEEEHRSSAEIQSDIRHTRERMDSTLDELGNRLTARSLLNTALDWWDSPNQGNQGSAAARKAALGLARQARRHPGPALLIGGAIAWLIADARSHNDEETVEMRRYRKYRAGRSRALASYVGDEDFQSRSKKSGRMSKAKHKVADVMEEAKHKAADVAESARETASEYGEKMHHMTDQLSEQAHEVHERGQTAIRRVKDELKEGYHTGADRFARASEEYHCIVHHCRCCQWDRFARASEEYPLAVGAGFLALGALVGLVIPHTRREDELMGETSDHLVEGAKEKAEELLESGKAVGVRVMDAAKDEAARAAEEEGLTSSQLEKEADETAGSRF